MGWSCSLIVVQLEAPADPRAKALLLHDPDDPLAAHEHLVRLRGSKWTRGLP
jgi:hypothetical protein